jgi:phosphatidylserine decarboxylase
MRDPAPQPALPPPPIIAREGWPIIAAIILILGALSAIAWWIHPIAGGLLAFASLIVTAWAVWFFRDPERAVPTGPGQVICPADGVISFVGPSQPPAELALDQSSNPPGPMTRISVFMNIFNVHVNRAPVAARIERISYRPGKFFNAALDKASEHNERCALALALPDGRRVAVVQIAGLIARRIVCRAKEGQSLAAGERFGLIRFGSRVDVYLPPGFEPSVRLGQAVQAGLTIIASVAPAAPDHAPSPAHARISALEA